MSDIFHQKSRLTLLLQLNGQADSVDLQQPGGTVRVAVGEPGRRSSIWKIFIPKKKDDVYVMARTIGGIQKFSLHASGHFRYGWTMEGAKEFGLDPTVTDRVVDRWERRMPDANGWTHTLSIFVPAEDVTALPDDSDHLEALWVPSPPAGRVAALHLAFVAPDNPPVTLQGMVPLAALRLPESGEALLLLAGQSDGSEFEGMLSQARGQALRALQIIGRDRDEPGLRMGVFGNSENGVRWVFDLAAAPYLREAEQQ